MKRLLWGLAASVLLLLPPRSTAGYVVTDLGYLGPGGAVYGINNAGQVVGRAQSASGTDHAFLYSGGVMSDLGTLGGPTSVATGINDLGQVVGASTTAAGYQHAFLYSGGKMQDLGTFGAVSSGAGAINDAGQIVGITSSFNFLYTGGKVTNLGARSGMATTHSIGINASGQVVGISALGTPFLYSGGVTTTLSGFGPAPSSVAINNAGQIVADGLSPAGGFRAYLYSGGNVTVLGTLGGPDAVPTALNNLGQVVGSSTTALGHAHAFLYSGGTMTDLNTFLPSGTGTKLDWAFGINDKGQIIAHGWNDHGYLLTPDNVAATPEPSTLALLMLGGAGLLAGCRRRWTRV